MKTYIEGNTLTYNQTLISDDRIGNIIRFAHRARAVQGDYAEFGVFRGGSLEIISKIACDRSVFGIDSFAGLPAPGKVDTHKEGDFKETNLREIVKWFQQNNPNVFIMQGFSPDVFAPLENSRFAFVHIDVDLYSSVIDACNFFFSRLNKGGIMIFDDYNFITTPGATKAVNEFCKGIKATWHGELKYPDGATHYQYLIIK